MKWPQDWMQNMHFKCEIHWGFDKDRRFSSKENGLMFHVTFNFRYLNFYEINQIGCGLSSPNFISTYLRVSWYDSFHISDLIFIHSYQNPLRYQALYMWWHWPSLVSTNLIFKLLIQQNSQYFIQTYV